MDSYSWKATISWVQYILDQYQEENDERLQRDDNISGILRGLMDKKGFTCDKDSFEEIVDYLLRNYF